MNETEEFCLYLGYLLGMLTRPEFPAAFIKLLASDVEGQDRVWCYTLRLRDHLSAALVAANRMPLEEKGS